MKRKNEPAVPEEPKKRITLTKAVSVEMEERKSIFIGHAAPVCSEEEARAFLESRRKEYHDATHNVYAYLLSGGAVARYSDDGEPQGTAGQPVFNVVRLSGATDLCVVVTRYFGGILLGAGGLVRAYSAAARLALDEAGLAVFEQYAVCRVRVSYSDYQKLSPALAKLGCPEDSCEFGEDVTVMTAIECSREAELTAAVSELSYGKGSCERIGFEERASRLV